MFYIFCVYLFIYFCMYILSRYINKNLYSLDLLFDLLFVRLWHGHIFLGLSKFQNVFPKYKTVIFDLSLFRYRIFTFFNTKLKTLSYNMVIYFILVLIKILKVRYNSMEYKYVKYCFLYSVHATCTFIIHKGRVESKLIIY